MRIEPRSKADRSRAAWSGGPDPEQRKQLAIAGRVGSVGIEIVVATVIGYAAGGWLDGRLGTAPWLTHAGLVLGIAAGLKGLYDVARRYRLEEL